MATTDDTLSKLKCLVLESDDSTKEPQSDDMALTPATTATNKTLNTPEILEKILLHLPALSAFPLKRVNKFWMQLISTSPQLQQHMFLRLPITQATSNTSTAGYEVWKLTEIRDEDFNREVVDMQRVHIVDGMELKQTEYPCVPVTANPFVRVVDGSTPLLERLNRNLQNSILIIREWDEYDIMMCDLPSGILKQPEATLWQTFLTSPASNFMEVTIFLRFGEGGSSSSSRDYPVMVNMCKEFDTGKDLQMSAILDVISEAASAFGIVDPQWDTRLESRPPYGDKYSPWYQSGLDSLSERERPTFIHKNPLDDWVEGNSENREEENVRPGPTFAAENVSLEEIITRIKEQYGWSEAQIGPHIKVVFAQLGDKDGKGIVVPDQQDRDQVRDYD